MNDETRLLRHPDYYVTVDGVKVLVRNGIFSPDTSLTHSSMIIVNHLPDLKDKDVLDIGTGSGIIAAICKKRGAKKVVASDINPHAIDNAKENLKHHNIEVIESNLFENINDSFDYILANLPISDTLWEAEEPTLQIIERFLKEAKSHLNSNGKIYLTWFSLREVEPIIDLIEKYHYSYETIKEEKFNFVWYLFKISK